MTRQGFPVRRVTVPQRQRGVALIIALILVALATLLATKLSFDGWLERRRTMGVLAAEQALQFGMGAEALAADVLSQMNGSQPVTLNQPWAQPTQPLPLTPENNPDGEPIGTLQGALEDLQSRFNLNNLARTVADGTPTGKPDPQPLEQFQRLLVAVGLEPKWAGIARDWIDADDQPGSPDGAEDGIYTAQTPPYRTGNWPMLNPSELMNMPGFGADRYRKIAPFVTALPTTTAKINICTAPTPVLESVAANMGTEYPADLLANGRKSGCFPDLPAFSNVVKSNDPKESSADLQWVGTSSLYFRLTTRVTLGTTEFTVYSLLNHGSGVKVTTLLRTFGTP